MKILALAPFIALALIVSFAFGACRPHRHSEGWDTERAVRFAARKLDLSKQQQEELERILADAKAEMAGPRERWEGSRDEVRRMILSDSISAADIEKMMAAHDEDREEVRGLFAEKAAEVHAILTPEQRQKLVDLMERRWRRHHS
jgi:Spy/CpxP family protein refolding chaperone